MNANQVKTTNPTTNQTTNQTTRPATRKLGAHGPQQTSSIALGAMGMSAMYGASDDAESIATIHAALDAGINLIDTGDFYGLGQNEALIGRALKDRRDTAMLSVKFGALRAPDGAWIGVDGRPQSVKNFLTYSLQRLGVDHIDIYRPARLDPTVPIEDTIGAIADMVKAGYVRHIGLSEVGAETIERAHKVHPISDLQIEYSLISRSAETKIFPLLKKLDIGVTAYGVLSRGLLSGSKPAGPTDYRAYLPRFSKENMAQNEQLISVLNDLASTHNATASQIAIAWVLAKGETILPVIGARKRSQLNEALGASLIHFSAAEIAQIEAAMPASAVAGERYDASHMSSLDSEK
jgi:aryl-alcohol dehydrogenase-like predicted oxidoreductase